MSRATSLQGLYVLGKLEHKHIKADPRVIEEYERLRSTSLLQENANCQVQEDDFVNNLNHIINWYTIDVILGDFNVNYFNEKGSHNLKNILESTLGYQQIVSNQHFYQEVFSIMFTSDHINLRVLIILLLGFTIQIMMQLKSSFIYDVNNNSS